MINLKRFFIIFLLYSTGIFFLALLFTLLAPEHMVSEVTLLMPPFFLLIVMVSRKIFSTIVKKNLPRFSVVFIAISGFRLLLYVALLVAYSLVFPHDAVPFIVSFFVFYLLFTSLEVYLLNKEMRSGSRV